MTSEAVLVELADITDPINGLGTAGGDIVRDRWNQRATVRVTDHPADNGVEDPALFVSDSLHNVWRLGHAKQGGQPGDGSGSAGSNFVIPQTP